MAEDDTNKLVLSATNNAGIISSYLGGELKPEELEDYISIGYAAREIRDLTQWIIGKLALDLTEKWGEGSLKEFCKRIGYGGLEKTVRVYRWVAEQYMTKYGKLPISPEGDVFSYTFYRLAAKYEDPIKLINDAKDENLTLGEFKRTVKGLPIPRTCKHEHEQTVRIVRCADCGANLGEIVE